MVSVISEKKKELVFVHWREGDYIVVEHLESGQVCHAPTLKKAEEGALALIELRKRTKKLINGGKNIEAYTDEISSLYE